MRPGTTPFSQFDEREVDGEKIFLSFTSSLAMRHWRGNKPQRGRSKRRGEGRESPGSRLVPVLLRAGPQRKKEKGKRGGRKKRSTRRISDLLCLITNTTRLTIASEGEGKGTIGKKGKQIGKQVFDFLSSLHL